ncbi:hypothetical protein U9M48_043991 [Paspalum notatum var. saurae]|uniref:LOB domain-containing protein n=1 Tax=Paspalum notatum var. saurae TaxID=547442 RepID=A0AAQ3XJ42_PASNO
MAASSASSGPPPAATSTGSTITVAVSPSMGGGAGGGGAGGGGTGSPCAACKFLRRRCQRDCVFAPYFPPENTQKFVDVHRAFGASNVTKILNDLPAHHREDAVNSLAYEADMRKQDPVYGCVGVISILQHRLYRLQQELARARLELSKYQAAAAAAEAATASVAVGSNNGAAGMADFVVGNPPVLNFTQTNFINVGPSTAAPMGGGAGFVQNDYLASVEMLARSHEAAAAARQGANNGGGAGGGYAFGYCSSAMGAAGHGVVPDQLGQIGGQRPGTASGDE